MFYLISKFHDIGVNTFGFLEGSPSGPGTPKKPRRNRVKLFLPALVRNIHWAIFSCLAIVLNYELQSNGVSYSSSFQAVLLKYTYMLK